MTKDQKRILEIPAWSEDPERREPWRKAMRCALKLDFLSKACYGVSHLIDADGTPVGLDAWEGLDAILADLERETNGLVESI